jgi:hypothetical protein
MSYYSAPFTFKFTESVIDVDSGATDIDCQDLYTACKLAQASEEGIIYGRIAAGSGLNSLGPGVQVGITVELLESWQLRFPTGNYIARVSGGNLIGGPGGDPIAYTAGVQTLLIQSAASTVVTAGGSIPTAAQNAAAVRTELSLELLRTTELAKVHGLVTGDPLTVTPTTRTAGSVTQTISTVGTTTTVTRT